MIIMVTSPSALACPPGTVSKVRCQSITNYSDGEDLTSATAAQSVSVYRLSTRADRSERGTKYCTFPPMGNNSFRYRTLHCTKQVSYVFQRGKGPSHSCQNQLTTLRSRAQWMQQFMCPTIHVWKHSCFFGAKADQVACNFHLV
ncbi:hypothetical protein PoB_001490300 [Plakobranchus ocellatus]|uniref:Secreted protein n=1 Tax=Plakobranchus ocellatus TaxID=259542 RepID=A0AAV3Z0V1_9GAST|nr:hypothetical protein PoB_001490300 [Plakobranchus ocellatus]